VGDWHFWLGLGLAILFVALWLWSYGLKTNIRLRTVRWNSARARNELAAEDLDARAREIFDEDPYDYDFRDPRNPDVSREQR
jgi:hypothetical protein